MVCKLSCAFFVLNTNVPAESLSMLTYSISQFLWHVSANNWSVMWLCGNISIYISDLPRHATYMK